MKESQRQNLKRLRELNDYTQELLSEKLGIARGAYANYEIGARTLPDILVEKLCKLYAVSREELLGESEVTMLGAFRTNNLSESDLSAIQKFQHAVQLYVSLKAKENNI